MIKKLAIIAILAGLAACSSSPSPILPPAPLPDIDRKLLVKRLWDKQVGSGASDKFLRLRPAVNENTGYAIDHQGRLFAWTLASGKNVWQKSYNVPVSSALTLHKGRIYFGTSTGKVYAIDAKQGRILWVAAVSSEVLAAPTVAGKTVIVQSVDGSLHALNRKSGTKRWRHSRQMPVLSLRGTSSPIVVDGIVISGADNGKLTALTLDRGALLWEVTIAVPTGRSEVERLVDIDTRPLERDGVIYTVSYQGKLAAVRIDSGRILWVRDISSYSGMALDSNRLYLTDAEGQVWAMDRFNGATLWRQELLLRRRLSSPVLQGRYLITGDFNGYIHWLSRSSGTLVARARLGETSGFGLGGDADDSLLFSKSRNILASPVVEDNIAVVMNRSGLLSAFQVKD